MGNTWIIDLRHYLTPTGAIAPLPSRARLLAEYFASIVVDATTNLDGPPALRCMMVDALTKAVCSFIACLWRKNARFLEVIT